MTTWTRDEFAISTDRNRLDVPLIHQYLSTSTYWATSRKLEIVQRSIENSLCFWIYQIVNDGHKQIGFGRVVTDYATFAWIADVFVVEQYRRRGLAKWMMELMVSHSELQGFRRWVLATKDAHDVYRPFGFRELHRPERWMERPDPNMQENPDYWHGKE